MCNEEVVIGALVIGVIVGLLLLKLHHFLMYDDPVVKFKKKLKEDKKRQKILNLLGLYGSNVRIAQEYDIEALLERIKTIEEKLETEIKHRIFKGSEEQNK